MVGGGGLWLGGMVFDIRGGDNAKERVSRF